MEGRYQRYSEYKDSGVEWVGKIPASWFVKPLFSGSTTESIKNDDGRETTVLSLSYGNIVIRDVEKNFGLLPESFNTYQQVNPGDLILRLTDLQNDKRSLRVGRANEKGIITSAYLKLTATKGKLDSKYLYRLLHSYDTTKVFYGMGGGLRQSMKFEDMRRLPLLVPPLLEQHQIANFLDHETAKIDTLIEKQQQLIALLKEKRQAVISYAVTKGLNPDAPMKDSGGELLGEVPAHWNVAELKRYANVQGGYAFDSNLFLDDGEPVIRIGDINQDGSVSLVNCKCVSRSITERHDQFTVNKGELVMAMTGATIGKAGWYKGEKSALVNQRVGVYKCDANILNYRYMWYLLKTSGYQEHIRLTAFGGAQPNISDTGMVAYKATIPPKDEQQQIAASLDHEIAKVDALIEQTQHSIDLSKERRTALISAAVTGKIDVRNWQPPTDKDIQ